MREIDYTLLNIEQAIAEARGSGHKSFQIEVTTNESRPCTDSNYYYIVVDSVDKIHNHIRNIMNFLFDILGYNGHTVDIADVSDDGYHSRQVTVRF